MILYGPFSLKLSAREAALKRDYTGFSNYNTQIIKEYPNSIHELTSLFDEISYQVEVQEDLEKAKKLLSRMDKTYPDDELTLMAHILIGENIDLKNPKSYKVAENKTEENVLKEFKLYPAFPNPFNPSTTISFDLPKDCHVRLLVYDLLGRKVMELVNKPMEKGNHSITFNGRNVASGVYVLKFQANTYSRSSKLVLMK